MGEEERKYADMIGALETEVAQLKAEHKRFGGMQLEKRKERLADMETELAELKKALG